MFNEGDESRKRRLSQMGLMTHLHGYDSSWKMVALSHILGVLCQGPMLQYSVLSKVFFSRILTPQKFMVCQFNWQLLFLL